MLSIGNIVRKSQPSMFWGMRNIAKPKREAMYTIFAFSLKLYSQMEKAGNLNGCSLMDSNVFHTDLGNPSTR